MNMAVLYAHLAVALALWLMLFLRKVAAFRGFALTASLLMVLTGAFNFMTFMKDAPKGWHMWIGIKILLALHAIAMVVLIARGGAPEAKLERWRKGGLITMTLAMLIGAYFSNIAR